MLQMVWALVCALASIAARGFVLTCFWEMFLLPVLSVQINGHLAAGYWIFHAKPMAFGLAMGIVLTVDLFRHLSNDDVKRKMEDEADISMFEVLYALVYLGIGILIKLFFC